jgi:hypothetical protein
MGQRTQFMPEKQPTGSSVRSPHLSPASVLGYRPGRLSVGSLLGPPYWGTPKGEYAIAVSHDLAHAPAPIRVGTVIPILGGRPRESPSSGTVDVRDDFSLFPSVSGSVRGAAKKKSPETRIHFLQSGINACSGERLRGVQTLYSEKESGGRFSVRFPLKSTPRGKEHGDGN